MKKFLLLALCIFPWRVLATPPPGYYLVWNDEFNGTSLDTSKWALRLGGAYRDGYNTLNAVTVGGGNLTITTYTVNGVNYTAMLTGANKFNSRYGYWESSVDWSDSNAVWSAFWFMSPKQFSVGGGPVVPSDPVVSGEEIDAAEHRYADGRDHFVGDQIQVAFHYKAPSQVDIESGQIGSGLYTGFHTYGFLWTPTVYRFMIDGVTNYNGGSAPISKTTEYPLLTSAVDDTSTTWAGHIPSGGYGDKTHSATRFVVDYVRYYAPTNVLFWTGASSAYWNNSANWVAGMSPLSDSDLTFSYLSKNNRSMTPGQNYTVHGLVFLDSGGAFSVNGANTVTVGAGGIDTIAANKNVTINAPINVAADQTWSVGPNSPGNILTINGSISGSGTVTKASYGTLLLNGANSFSGTLNVDTGSSTANDGVLRIGNAAGATNISSIAIRNTGSAVSSLQLSNSVSVAGMVSLAGRSSGVPAIESLFGNNTLGGGITLSGGGSLYQIQSDLGSLNLDGSVLAGGTATGARTLTLQGNGGFSILGSIANGSASPLNLVKTNAGTLTFWGASTYSGSTVNERGTMFVNGSIAGSLTVNGGVLGGKGLVGGAATIGSGCELTPGTALVNSLGTISFGSSLTLSPGCVTLMEINPGLNTNDEVNVAGTVNYGGTLYVSNMGGTPVPGQRFKLFNAGGYSGSFSAVTLPPLSGGLSWDSSGLTNGELRVVAPPQTLGFTNPGEGQMQLNWTYGTLQSATNVAGPYLDVPGAVTPYTINPTNEQQYYRLKVY